MRLTGCVLAVVLAAVSAAAQERLTPDQFMDRAEGRTLTFRGVLTGDLIGIEQFLSRSRSVWARADGRCTYGRITLEGLYICFRYEDDPGVDHCWIPYLHEETLMVRSTEGQLQQVSRITTRPVVCQDAPLS